MQHSIELRRRSGEGLLKPSDDGPSSSVLEDRGAAGFGLANEDAAARRSQAQQQREQQRSWPGQRQRRRFLFFAAAAAVAAAALLSLLVTLLAWSRRNGEGAVATAARGVPVPSRPGAMTRSGGGGPSSSSSSSPPLPSPQPPPSSLCAPADAAARLAFFRGRLAGFSFPTATALLSPGVEKEAEQAQELIDQGWLLYRGFHRAAAAAAFSAALEISRGSSSGAALGLAWALGPGANLVAVDEAVPWPAFEAGRDFPRAAEAAAAALRLAEEAAAKEEEDEEGRGGGGDDGDDEDKGLRLRRRALIQRDLALARIAAARFAPGTSSGRARERAEAEAAVMMEEAARNGSLSPSSPFPADPSLLALAAELEIHEGQWDYWELPAGQENADEGAALDDGEGWPGPASFLTMKPHAAAAAALVQEALRLDPSEPLALHLAVHLSEAAPPEQAAAMGLAAADALAGIVRGGGGGGKEEEGEVLPARQALEAATAAAADGTALLLPTPPSAKPAPWISAGIPHLLHMPVHLFTRAGLYQDAVFSGLAASRADDAMAAACIESYAVEHNAAALVFAANACGRRKVSEIQVARLARSKDSLGPALLYAEGTVEVTLGISTEVLFADWGAVRKRRFREAQAALEAEVEEAEEEEKGKRRRWWWPWPLSSPSSSSSSSSSSASSSLFPNERGLCVAGGAEFAAAMKAAASALELAAAAEKAAAAGLGGGGGDVEPSAAALSLAEAAVRRAEALAASLAPEPRTRPGGGPHGIYACGHGEVAAGLAALARARLLLARGGSGGAGARKTSDDDDDDKQAAAARAAARALERHELVQSRSAYIEPPRSQVPLAPCLGYLLLRAGDPGAAARAFRRDLAARPANGRGLLGLALALEEGLSSSEGGKSEAERGRRLAETARRTREAFEAAWRGADAPLSSPCPALSD